MSGCTWPPQVAHSEQGEQEPIIFVHGNGDQSALWISTAWRFESNGWRSDRLFAFDLPHPLSRDIDALAQDNRSSAEEYTAFLRSKVAEVRARTGASQVILIGNSRGGYPIRRFIRDGGAAEVSAAILGGTPNHGTYISETLRLGSEYNGAGPWLKALNAPQGPAGAEEVTPGVRFLTLRSDGNDKYAQPTGVWFGFPDLLTHITAEGPALAGATNQIVPQADHRETAYSFAAFAQMLHFLRGRSARPAIQAEPRPRISGRILALQQGEATNLPLAHARLSVFLVDAASGKREGPAVHQEEVGADGVYGPVELDSAAHYEFEIVHPQVATTHLYPGRLLRSTPWLNLVPQPDSAQPALDSRVQLVRLSGYFNTQRDQITVDGQTPLAIQTSLPALAVAAVTVPAAEAMRAVVTRYDDEMIVVPAWPGRDAKGHAQCVVAELLD